MATQELLADILVQVGETHKGVENLEQSMMELKGVMFDLTANAMRREECRLLHDQAPKERRTRNLQRTLAIIASMTVLLGFLGSMAIGFVRMTQYFTQIDQLARRAEALQIQKHSNR